jgi:hypothetical protein
MIAKFLRFPWARLACVLGSILTFAALDKADEAPLAFATFMFAGVALHGLAIWREKP